jgi:hypothetical protein
MKVGMFVFTALTAFSAQTSPILRVTTLGMANAPVGFAQVEVRTPGGKKVASAFTSSHGRVEFKIQPGEYVVSARSFDLSKCTTQIRAVRACAGQVRVSVKPEIGLLETSVELRPPAIPYSQVTP